MTKLEGFLTECGITFKTLNFQANSYLENPFIKNIESVESLEIINNTGVDRSEQLYISCYTIDSFELIAHPITALHFNTLTQNVLKISDNSQSSLLQKVAKILIEN